MRHAAELMHMGQPTCGEVHAGCNAAGAEDPWEKVEWGRKLQHYPTVEEFRTFPGKVSSG